MTPAEAAPSARGRMALPPAEDPALPAPGRSEEPAPARRGRLTLVLPAKDEEAGLAPTLRALPLATLEAMGFEPEVLVLDGRSRDATREVALRWGAQVYEQVEPGKGAALREALPLLQGEYVVMVDADATYACDAIPRVADLLARGEADVVMGSRRRGRRAPGAMSGVNSFGNAALSAAASVLFLRRCTDVCTGLWGFRGEALRALPLEARGFELEVELFGRAARAGLVVREVPVDYLPRRGPTKLNRARDGLRIGYWLLRTRLARAPGPLRAAEPRPLRAAEPRPATPSAAGPARAGLDPRALEAQGPAPPGLPRLPSGRSPGDAAPRLPPAEDAPPPVAARVHEAPLPGPGREPRTPARGGQPEEPSEEPSEEPEARA